MSKPRKKINLVLTNHWYDETAAGRKRVEYRSMINPEDGSPSRWLGELWHHRHTLEQVQFSRGYTPTTQTFDIVKIDVGPCPIPGWTGDYYRIHFKESEIPR